VLFQRLHEHGIRVIEVLLLPGKLVLPLYPMEEVVPKAETDD
jgi:hypothetical protein